MANIQSQIKRNRQNEKAHERNKAVRTRLKTQTKKALAAAEAGDLDAAREQFRDTVRGIDKAVAKGILHKNTAARQKSRLARNLAEAGAAPKDA